MSDLQDLPLRHKSTARLLGTVACTADHAVENETPLFASDLDFAFATGGSLTRTFLESIPLDWNQGAVVDSSLVWLSPGLTHGFVTTRPLAGPRAKIGFVHEPFPGIMTGVCGDSNRNLQAVHWLGVFGLDCTPELAEGELAFDTQDDAREFWLPTETLAFREHEIARRTAAGELQSVPLPVATVIEFGWGTLLRLHPAAAHGFQFIIRVTSGDDRPYVNGFRNHAQV